MTVRVYNSLTREKEDLVPLRAGKLGVYVCGVTVYDLCHVGHARVYTVFDTIVRWLRREHQVTYVRNFTDVDDKTIRRSNERGEDPIALDARFADESLIFPHHTNEIAQSECCHDPPMAKAWVHNGFINFNDEKKAKSVGNFFTIRELWPYCTGEALRFFLLATHYRGDVNFDVEASCPHCQAPMTPAEQSALSCGSCGMGMTQDELRSRVRFPNLEEAERRVQYLYQTMQRIKRVLATRTTEDGPSLEFAFSKPGMLFTPWADFEAGLNDDFNTPRGIAALNEVLKVVNLLVAGREKELIGNKLKPGVRALLLNECLRLIRDMGKVLGLGEAALEGEGRVARRRRSPARRAHGEEGREGLRRRRRRARAPRGDGHRDHGRAGGGVEWSLM